MAYCPRCGVEAEAGRDACPLCATAIPRLDDAPPAERRYPTTPAGARLTERQVRRLIWGIVTSVLVTALSIVAIVDLTPDLRFTWVGYPAATMGVAWAYLTVILRLIKRPWLIVVGLFASTTIFLGLMDGLDGEMTWYLPVGLPVVGMSAVAVAAVFLLGRWCAWRASGVFAWALVVAGILCVGVDIVVSRHTSMRMFLWSPVVIAASFLPAAVLAYYDVSLRHRVDISKYFHV